MSSQSGNGAEETARRRVPLKIPMIGWLCVYGWMDGWMGSGLGKVGGGRLKGRVAAMYGWWMGRGERAKWGNV